MQHKRSAKELSYSLNVICEKAKFSNCEFCNIFCDAYIQIISNIFSDVQTEGKGEINTARC